MARTLLCKRCRLHRRYKHYLTCKKCFKHENPNGVKTITIYGNKLTPIK